MDRVIEALDMAAAEADRASEPNFAPNPMMLGQSGSAHVLSALQGVRANDLETVLLLLPFSDALLLLSYLPSWLTTSAQVRARAPPAPPPARLTSYPHQGDGGLTLRWYNIDTSCS